MALPEREQRIRIAVFDLNPNTGAFREHTYTLTVGPAAATILLRHPVVVGTTLTIYNLENGRQADFVVESAPAPRQVRLAPADPAVDIWELNETASAPPLPEETRVAREQNELGRAAIASIATGSGAEAARAGTIEGAAGEAARAGTDGGAAREARRVGADEAVARKAARAGADEAAAREAAAGVVEAEGTVGRAVDYTHLLDAHVAEQTRALELTQQEAMAVALRAAQSLRRELEEMADRAVLVRDRAKKLTREAADACARAAACTTDLQALRADKKGADQKLVEARRHLEQAEAAFAAVRAEVARATATSRPATAQPAEAPVAAEPVPEPVLAAEPVPEPVMAAEPAAATAQPAEAPVAAELVPEPVMAAEPPATTAQPTEAPVAAEPVLAAESVAAAGARRGPSLTTTQQFAAGFSGNVRWDDRRTTRRLHVRTRARIRRPDLVEILEPINVSRRGLCFESDYSYELNSMVWVALHYQEDMPDLLETPSRVVRIIPRENGAPVRYGVHFEI